MSRERAEARNGRFSDPGVLPDMSVLATRKEPFEGTSGKKLRVLTNTFQMVMSPNGCINHYNFAISPATKSREEENKILEAVWSDLQKEFGRFVIRGPKHIFSPTSLERDIEKEVYVGAGQEKKAYSVSIKFFEKIRPDQVNGGALGSGEVVLKHIIKRLAEPLMERKIGRRYYKHCDLDGKASSIIFSGYHIALAAMARSPPRMHIDTAFRALHRKNVLESLQQFLDTSQMAYHDDADVQLLWRQKLVHATVATTYTNRLYRIKDVRFDMTPDNTFKLKSKDVKGVKKIEEISFFNYYNCYYQRKITEMHQPLIEAYAERNSEQVFLVPELCSLTGFSDEMRKDKGVMGEVLKQAKVAPQERFQSILDEAAAMADLSASPETGPSFALMQDWKLQMDRTPLEVEARTLDPLEVNFGAKQFTVEEGSFQRWMRNGLQCPMSLEDWVFICPETDVNVVDVWLRSLKDIAWVAFKMQMRDPVRVVCESQREEIEQAISKSVTPSTQMVLLLTPQKDSRRVYQIFKQATMSRTSRNPCVSQVVKSETIRKRNNIASVLSRIVLQMNAKMCGPLWHIELACPATMPLYSGPTMSVGIDVFCAPDGQEWLGFAASLDTAATEFYSNALRIDPESPVASICSNAQACMRDALIHFNERNEGVLPEYVVVYRGSLAKEDWVMVLSTEVKAISEVLKAVESTSSDKKKYVPKLTFVGVARRSVYRFFAPTSDDRTTVKNLEAGTVIDSPLVVDNGIPSFFLVSQAVGKGTAVPMQYVVLHDDANLPADALQSVTYRLSHLYFNYTGGVRCPAPLQYASKVAHFVGTSLRQPPHPRLLRTFFYL